MKITFVTPFIFPNGGMRVVATYARALSERGHKVTVVAQPDKPKFSFKDRMKLLAGRHWRPAKLPRSTLFDFLGPNLRELPEERPVTAADLPDADVIVATWWETAEPVAKMPPEKGAKVYFLQDYEVFDRPYSDRVIATFRADMTRIAVSDYIAGSLSAHHDVTDVEVIPNAVDHAQFNAPPRGRGTPFRVGSMYTGSPRKRVWLATEALERAKAELPELEAVFFGSGRPGATVTIPSWSDYRQRPTQAEIPGIYASCDAWLFASEKEGFGLPLLEAMACRTPVVATRAGISPTLVTPKNGRLVDGDAQSLADAILTLARLSETEWRAVSEAAHATALTYNWAASADRFEAALARAADVSRAA